MNEPLRVVVADDHPLFREGVIAALRSVPDIQVVGEAADADGALRLARREVPDVVLLDLGMPGGGLEATRRIVAACPGSRLVILTASETADDLLEAVKAGASGFVLKGASSEELASVVRAVSAGELYAPPTLAWALLRGRTQPPHPIHSRVSRLGSGRCWSCWRRVSVTRRSVSGWG
jgi:two-component system nitrate/nitrite response regulator NarL